MPVSKSRVRRRPVPRPRRRAFARALHAARRTDPTVPISALTPAVDAFDRRVAMTRDDLQFFGVVIQESFDAGRAVGEQHAREMVTEQARVIMRYFAGHGLSLFLDPLWLLLVFLRVPLDHTAIAADAAHVEGPDAAADYLTAARHYFNRQNPTDADSRQ